MNATLSAALAATLLAGAVPAFAQITFYEHEGFRGRAHTTNGALDNFAGWDFNNRASSVVVASGRWEVCDGVGFQGRCALLRPGSYDRLSSMGLNDRLASARPANAGARHANEAPPPMRNPNYAYRQRPNERLVEVPVRSVRAVLSPPSGRCWVDRQAEREGTSASRGVMGHQTGRSAVRRCEQDGNDSPSAWDVGYTYRGIEHHVQMSEPPGPTLTVNRNGEPRL